MKGERRDLPAHGGLREFKWLVVVQYICYILAKLIWFSQTVDIKPKYQGDLIGFLKIKIRSLMSRQFHKTRLVGPLCVSENEFLPPLYHQLCYVLYNSPTPFLGSINVPTARCVRNFYYFMSCARFLHSILQCVSPRNHILLTKNKSQIILGIVGNNTFA